MPKILLILHNIRSSYNVGSILRTAEGFGIKEIICSGYTPYPKLQHDIRLPHVYNKLHSQIVKTSLGAENLLNIKYQEVPSFEQLKHEGYKIIGLEQHEKSINITKFKPPDKIALLVGEEVKGISPKHLLACDQTVEIPMLGKKESFNVSIACAIALYAMTT